MTAEAGAMLSDVRARVDDVLLAFLRETRGVLEGLEPHTAVLADELLRIVGAGGKRIRPLLCVLGYRAVGADDDAVVVPAAASLELFHTFALVHDDVMDDDPERRGVPSTHRRFADDTPGGEGRGRAVAILVGDLALALAYRLLLRTPVPPERLTAALGYVDRMALDTAAGQFLDITGTQPEGWETLARLKTGTYTVSAPLMIGVELAGVADGAATSSLEAFAEPLGVAFQLRDDVLDGTVPPERAGEVDALLQRATRALDPTLIESNAAAALAALAEGLRLPA